MVIVSYNIIFEMTLVPNMSQDIIRFLVDVINDKQHKKTLFCRLKKINYL
jgi:uncharacterized membrane protein